MKRHRKLGRERLSGGHTWLSARGEVGSCAEHHTEGRKVGTSMGVAGRRLALESGCRQIITDGTGQKTLSVAKALGKVPVLGAKLPAEKQAALRLPRRRFSARDGARRRLAAAARPAGRCCSHGAVRGAALRPPAQAESAHPQGQWVAFRWRQAFLLRGTWKLLSLHRLRDSEHTQVE